mmetsp:Transcript_17866/g.29785  ORF Transcript_17866/g.29785 Transcript_17866/m.29785 type:complete len:444 (+) Transcript_17866:145-1476(+)
MQSGFSSSSDGDFGIVRIKPLGAGGGGGERSAMNANAKSITFSTNPPGVKADGRKFVYPAHIITPEMDQQALYDAFMPKRVDDFLSGVNVNVMAYGQTGSGKTHTMFGTPGILARAANGCQGQEDVANFGLFPRGLLAVFAAVKARHKGAESLVLTGSAVELSVQGNQDMLLRVEEVEKLRRAAASEPGNKWDGGQLGVSLDKTANPPRLFGMTELPLDTEDDLRKFFAALATRNTASTLMNDSSSRSHCFAYLTLRAHDRKDDTVRTSRFQFCDLAGSERLKEAHGHQTWKDGGEALNGLVTNYSLMMLSSCVRGLVEARRKGTAHTFSFKAYLGDLHQLLKQSMTGEASTACFVCLSQAPDNLMQSKFALDFGEVFAKLSMRPVRQKQQPRTKLIREATAMLSEAERVLSNGGGGRYKMMRIAQSQDARQQLALLQQFERL